MSALFFHVAAQYLISVRHSALICGIILCAGCGVNEKRDVDEAIPKIDPPLRRFELDACGFGDLSADGKWTIIGKDVDDRGSRSEAQLFDLVGGKTSRRFVHSSQAYFTPDGKGVFFADVKQMAILDLATQAVRTLEDVRGFCEQSVDGRYFYGAGGSIWDTRSGKLLHKLALQGGFPALSSTVHLATASSEVVEYLKVEGEEAQKEAWHIHIWDISTGDYLGQAGPTTYSLAPDGRFKHKPGAMFEKLPRVNSFTKLFELGIKQGAYHVRIANGRRPMVFPRLPNGALEGAAEKKKEPDARRQIVLRDRVTGDVFYRLHDPALDVTTRDFDNPLLETRVSADNGTLLAFLRTKEKKNLILVWDISAFRKYAARERPDLTADDWKTHWLRLGDNDPRVAFKAMRRLAASPKQTLKMLDERLKPVNVDKIDFPALIRDLDGNFDKRDKSEKALRSAGDEAIPFLEKALKEKQSLEARRRTQEILKTLEEVPLPDVETRRLLWSIEMLEFLGTPEAKKLLERLTEGTPTAWVTLEARASLERLKK